MFDLAGESANGAWLQWEEPVCPLSRLHPWQCRQWLAVRPPLKLRALELHPQLGEASPMGEALAGCAPAARAPC